MSACVAVGIACWGSDMVKDAIGMLVLTALVIALGTNFVSETHNIWAWMAQSGR
jgi:hypothetical protein